jgi:lipopolysaccharide/colanic/teichoic acid biosynthesis glycosyltransferase
MTGLAQATLRSQASPEQRLALDLRYAREHSLWLDLRILAWTVGRLSGKGAN